MVTEMIDMFQINNNQATLIEPKTFRELGMTEQDIEELLKENIHIIAREENMLIIGQQVINAQNGRCDLVAINENGDLVLIEIKRDQKDIESRREPFEFQAIRYAAALAKIKDLEELISKIYVPFLEKNHDTEDQSLTINEIANRKLEQFFNNNNITLDDFNKRQQIILVASEFDEQTLSAVAWLNSNGVEMSCIQLKLYQIDGNLYVDTEKVLPLPNYEDYYVEILEKRTKIKQRRRSQLVRRDLPRIDAMLKWGVVKAGDRLKAKNYDSYATLLANGNVEVDGEEKSLQKWLRDVTGWSAVETYTFTIHVESGKSLSDIRREDIEKHLNVKFD